MDRVYLRRIAVLSGPVVGVVALLLVGLPARGEAAAPRPTFPQPTLPANGGGAKPTSPVIEKVIAGKAPLVVHKHVARHRNARHRHFARYSYRKPYSVRDLDRPALAGVVLLAPLPPPPQPPHVVVPLPAYPLESIVAAFTTPPPPVVCHRVRREPVRLDPGLYRERTVQCLPDNP